MSVRENEDKRGVMLMVVCACNAERGEIYLEE